MSFPVFDLHCDTALALLGKDMKTPGSLKSNELHVDLDRAKTLNGYAQCFACFTTPAMEEWMKVSPVSVFEKEIAILQKGLWENRDVLAQAYTAQDVEENLQKGIMSAIFTIEGPAGFGFDPALLEILYQIGFRITSLGWNEKNLLAGSNATGGGLTDMGKAYVAEAQRLGMIVDVSHISDEGFPTAAAADHIGAQLPQRIRGVLGVAATDTQNGIGVFPAAPTDDGAVLPVCHCGDRAGIDDISVTRLAETANGMSPVQQKLLHRLGLILIDLAAQCIKTKFHC